MASHTFLARLMIGLVSLAALLPFGAARAQSLDGGWNDLENAWGKRRKLATQLLRGETTFDSADKSHDEALDLEARVVTYRVYLDHLETRDEKPSSRRPTMDRAYTDFENDLDYLKKSKADTKAAAEKFRDHLRVHAKEVIDFDKAKPIHKLFNARVLAEVANLGQPQMTDTLVEVLKDEKQNDAVHYYALRGLRNLLAVPPPMPMQPVLTKEQETKCAEAIINFLEKKQGPSKDAAKDEIDGFRVLRREAIRALAQIHAPSFGEKVRPALVLARFAGADESIQPEPRIDERVEAAIGLARLQSAQDRTYQPDYGANQIGRCLGTFGQQFSTEKANRKENADSIRPWKIDAYRFNEALNALKMDTKDAYVGSVIERGARVLRDVMKGDSPKADDLIWFSSSEADPPSKELFKDAADAVVKPAKPAEK